jgi:hypothetical protein
MGVDLLAELQDMFMPGPLGGAVHIPGDGRCRKRRGDQTRHIRRQPAGSPGLFFQGPSSEDLDHDYLCRCLKCCQSATASVSSIAAVPGNWPAHRPPALFVAVSVYVILDIEYPRLGLIRVDAFDQAFVDLRESMNP